MAASRQDKVCIGEGVYEIGAETEAFLMAKSQQHFDEGEPRRFRLLLACSRPSSSFFHAASERRGRGLWFSLCHCLLLRFAGLHALHSQSLVVAR